MRTDEADLSTHTFYDMPKYRYVLASGGDFSRAGSKEMLSSNNVVVIMLIELLKSDFIGSIRIITTT